jgi:hypothetical protein
MSDSERINEALDVIYPAKPAPYTIEEFSDTLKALTRIEYLMSKKQSMKFIIPGNEADGIGDS